MNINGNDPSEIATSQGKPENKSFGLLRTVAFIALVVGAVGSVGLMFREGQHTPRLLLFVFIIWVISPFAGLLWINRIAKRWSIVTQVTVYCVTLIVAVSSVAIYSRFVDLKPAGSANAFLFVAIPPVTGVLIIIVISIAAFVSNRLLHRGAE